MDPLIATALDTARARGAEYADIRLVSNREQRIVVRNGVVETMTADESVGLGIRAVFQGAWGFASTRELTGEAADQAAGQAVQIARASASQNGSGQTAGQLLGSPVASQGSYTTPMGIDPFTVPLEAKLALLLEADRGDGRGAASHGADGQRGVHPRGSAPSPTPRGRWLPRPSTRPAAGCRPPRWATARPSAVRIPSPMDGSRDAPGGSTSSRWTCRATRGAPRRKRPSC